MPTFFFHNILILLSPFTLFGAFSCDVREISYATAAVLWDLEAGGLFLTDPNDNENGVCADNGAANNHNSEGAANNFSESLLAAPADPKPTLTISLHPTRNAATTVSVQVWPFILG